MTRENFKSRSGFILACVGAAVGLGDSLRFPGLCAKYGGGAFMAVYIVALLTIGIPVLNVEIALGRKLKRGAPQCMASLHRHGEKLGWASCFNSLGVAVLYAGMLGWIIAMLISIVPLCRKATSLPRPQISEYFFTDILGGFSQNVGFSPLVLICVALAWVLMFFCVKNGVASLSKTAKFTVLIPIAILAILAVRGMLYSNSFSALRKLFVPKLADFCNAQLWLSAVGQVFFSLSVLVGIMPAYGAHLPEGECVLYDSLIIAFCDFFVSVLASVVLFTTLYGCGLEGQMSPSGIVTAFKVYPVAITLLFGAGNTAINALVGILFYASLGMMALQSAASMVEAAVLPLSQKFTNGKRRITVAVIGVGALCGTIFCTGVAPVVLDTADHFLNYFNILLLGVAECALLGANVKRAALAEEINRHCRTRGMPQGVLIFSLKILSPAALSALFLWGLYHLIFAEHGVYAGYPVWAQALGWGLSAGVFIAGCVLGKNTPVQTANKTG